MEVWIGLTALMGVILYFDYKEKALKTKQQGAAEPDEKLLARIDALEKQCAKLQEQVTDAHALLADERRALDQKLAAMLPEQPISTAAESRTQTPMRVREH
jgi:hypothetical protein